MKYLLMLTAVLSTACTWVKPEQGGEQVALRKSSEINLCQKKGNVEVKTLGRVGFVDRGVAKVASELLTLAQNEAVVLGGNTLVPISEIEDGTQRFAVYSCQGN